MITDCGPSKGARRCLSHEKSYQGQKSGWSNLSCHCWDYSERLSNLLKFKLKCPFTAPKSKSRMRPRPSMLWWSFLLIVALLLESSMVSCFPVIPASESPSSTSQVHPKHHHHRHQVRHHHHHQRDRAAKQQHPKHFHVESLEMQDTGASLSIITPLDVLRQNMLLEMQRKRLRDAKSKQVKFNTEFLERIG